MSIMFLFFCLEFAQYLFPLKSHIFLLKINKYSVDVCIFPCLTLSADILKEYNADNY